MACRTRTTLSRWGWKRAVVALLVLLGGTTTVADAQQLRGVVRDSATQTPLPGVVITLMNASGGTLARAISNERGAYVIGPTDGAVSVGAIRIGFRPRRVPFVAEQPLDLTMTPIPPLLEAVTVRAAPNCPARRDRVDALSLLQQARAGLLATVTARETNKASIMRLRFVRDYDENGKEIVSQRVAVDSTGGLSESFGAVKSGEAFVAKGFVDVNRDAGTAVHYGPDAETLLDDDFAAGYCFHVADRDDRRPNEIGLGFKAASRKNGRVDIEGTLWIDTVAKALHDIDFIYIGDTRPVGAPQSGGHIGFRMMANGIVIIDRWSLRLPSSRVVANSSIDVRNVFHVQEVGGEVATATWSDGFTWTAPLGTLRALAIDYRNFIARGVVVRLKDTDYLASPNEQGILEIPHLLPGPYVAIVSDSATQRLGILMPTSLSFSAERDSTTERSFTTPRHEDYVLNSCLTRSYDSTERPPMVIRVIDAFGKRVVGAVVDIRYDDGSPKEAVFESIDTDDKGTAQSCLRIADGAAFDITVTYGKLPPFTGRYRFGASSILVRLVTR